MDYIDQTQSPFKTSKVFILPHTKRYEELQAKRLEEENQRKQEAEELEKRRKEYERKEMEAKREKDAQKKKLEEKKRQDELRKQEENAQVSKLEGKFGVMITTLKNNTTVLDFSVSGVNLNPAQIRALAKNVGENASLKTLSLSRKQITDDDGADIASSLMNNKVLLKLELDDNNLGTKAAIKLGELITNNRFVRVISLESNNLGPSSSLPSSTGKVIDGVVQMAEALAKNQDLLCLNLNNTNLSEEAGAALAKAMRTNYTLIQLDVESNKKMNYKDVLEIQEALIRNKMIYDEERLQEWRERKVMHKEEEDMDVRVIKEEENKEIEKFEARFQVKLEKEEEELDNEMEKEEIQKQKQMQKLAKEADLLKGKKKKKKAPAKK